VVARGRGRGGGTVYSSEDKMMLTHLDLAKNLITGMAGVAAEDYVFGMLSTGGQEDLDIATKTAHAMVSVYGMSEAIGPVTVGEIEGGTVFVGGEGSKTANVAAATQELIDSETRRLVHEAEETAEQILDMNRDVLDQVANTLIDSETLAGEQLDAFLALVRPWPQPLVKGLNGTPPRVPLREPAVASADTEIRYENPPGPAGFGGFDPQ
jgi:cell division protease FtsH